MDTLTHNLACEKAAQLIQEAQEGAYTVNGERVDHEHIGCALVEFLDRLVPTMAPHEWSNGRHGFDFRSLAEVPDESEGRREAKRADAHYRRMVGI